MLYWFTADSPPLPRIVLFTESAPSPVCRPIAHENAKCGQFFSCILNETGVYYCQRAMRYFGPEYMPSEAVFKLISLAKFRGILRLKPGFRHRGFESSTLRHFFLQKNGGTKPQGFSSRGDSRSSLKTEGFLPCHGVMQWSRDIFTKPQRRLTCLSTVALCEGGWSRSFHSLACHGVICGADEDGWSFLPSSFAKATEDKPRVRMV